MNELKILNKDGQLYASSNEVAEMLEMQHKNLLRTINNYVGILTGSKLSPSDFFVSGNYQDNKGEIRPCWFLTKKGCDMVANKMTGEKGVLFTATYVTQFEKMETALKGQPRILSEREQLMASLKLSMEAAEEIPVIKQDVSELKRVFDEELTLNHGQQQVLHHEIKKRVENIYGNYAEDITKQGMYSQIHKQLRRAFSAPKYIFVKRKDYEEAIAWVKAWRPLF